MINASCGDGSAHRTLYNRGVADSNRRRGARIPTSVSFEITGPGSAPALRRGDISSSGLYIEGDSGAGGIGTVKHLRVGLPGVDRLTEVLGRVVRRVVVEDLCGTAVMGVAFEFLFTDDESRADVARMVESLADRERSEGDRSFAIQHAFEAEVGRPSEERHDATVYVVGMDTLSLETAWPARPGEVIECVVRAPLSNREFTFTGRVVGSEPVGDNNDRYRVDIRFASDTAPEQPVVSGASIDDAINVLLEESIRPRDYSRLADANADMRGNTTHVPLHSLLTLAEMERLTGVLTLEIDGGAGTVFLRDGRVVDVELSTGAHDPRDALNTLMEWSNAEFEYTSGDVDRPDRLDAKTWVLLLELAKQRDERPERTTEG